jgi:hypothetical protein
MVSVASAGADEGDVPPELHAARDAAESAAARNAIAVRRKVSDRLSEVDMSKV